MADAGYLTIGKVVARLQSQYPDLTVSKVRYLEDEGLLTPSRTPGGYRLYSTRDIKRLETILYLQKNRFLPLQVIKEELAKGDVAGADGVVGAIDAYPQAAVDDEETVNKLHPLERIPELLGVSCQFIRQLAEQGVITLKRSPQGRELVDGRDFALIRAAEALRRYGFGPKNLRQYVIAANRESTTIEQALSVYGPRAGEFTDEQRQNYEQALEQILSLTNIVRDTLIRRTLRDTTK
jgi:DNA-binding transcriptional MerR regulator